MNIFDEVKQIFSMILDHHEDLERLDFSARMKNGAVIRYNFDRKKIERQKERELQPRGRREIFNAVLDIVGIAVSISFLVLLLVYGIARGSVTQIIAFSAYGTLLVLYFLVSTLYHFLTDIMKLKDVFLRLVELFTYFLLAGTYVPVFLVSLSGGASGWALFGAVWALAVLGILFKNNDTQLSNRIAEFIAILMIWVFIPSYGMLEKTLGAAGMSWLILGASFYTLWRISGILTEETPPRT